MRILRAAKDFLWLYAFKALCRVRKPHFEPLKFLRSFLERIREKIFKHQVLVPRELPRRIWIFWAQGWDNAPPLAKLCRDSWIAYNPDWEVVQLSRDNLSQYITLEHSLKGKDLPLCGSDIIRVSILAKYGGVWVDATVLASASASKWLPPLTQSGFFAFNKKSTTIASWFLAAEPNNILVKSWKGYVDRYWRLVKKEDRYFWLMYLFEYLLKLNLSARDVWSKTPKVSSDGPYAVQQCLRKEGCNPGECADMISSDKYVAHKLSLHLEVPDAFLEEARQRLNDLTKK